MLSQLPSPALSGKNKRTNNIDELVNSMKGQESSNVMLKVLLESAQINSKYPNNTNDGREKNPERIDA